MNDPIVVMGYTRSNPDIHNEYGDITYLFDGKSTFPVNLMEYAGRLCYASLLKMGTSKSFIPARIREGHEDIIEHSSITISIPHYIEKDPYAFKGRNQHCQVTQQKSSNLVTANARVWRDLIKQGVAPEILPALLDFAPEVFEEFRYVVDENESAGVEFPKVLWNPERSRITEDGSLGMVRTYDNGQTEVSLVACSQTALEYDSDIRSKHNSATFLLSGVSRALTHQLVRHRLASFSQESQRYVDMKKGGWSAVFPPKIMENPAARKVMQEAWDQAESSYRKLRDLKIRKEDARFLLPNASETKILVTMSFEAWKHFLWIRAIDKAAQWEIKTVGLAILYMLHAIDNEAFHDHWIKNPGLSKGDIFMNEKEFKWFNDKNGTYVDN